MDDDKNDDDDGWEILRPGVLLFQTTIGSLDKPIPHPVLDDSSKMLRIIANPLYDKLTVSRAAHIQKYNSPECLRQSSHSSRSKERATQNLSKSIDIDQTTITSFASQSEILTSRPQSKTSSKRQISVPFRLPSTPASTRKSPRNLSSATRSRVPTARSITHSIQSTLINSTSDTKKSIEDGTIRYVNSRHGFEVQRYSSSNWLTTDIFTKDACQSHEKTYQEMLDKKHQYERLSRSIYSSEYYSKRWNELLESYNKGYLTHAEWAKQNYQLFCLKTLYTQAKKREKRDRELYAQDIRYAHATNAFNQWKENKSSENFERQQSRMNTSHSQRITDGGASFLSNNSFINPILNATDENSTTIIDTGIRTSISTNNENESQRTSNIQTNPSSKNLSTTENALYMLDEQRWSLQAMLKRVVGLAEPLPPPPKILARKQSPITTASTDSGFESIS